MVEGLYSMEADLWEPRACSCEHLDLDRIREENIKGSLKWCLVEVVGRRRDSGAVPSSI